MTRTVAIIQARLGSTRLPGKVLRPILGRPMLWHIVNRLRQAECVDQVMVATSDVQGDELLRTYCESADIACFAGSENDVLDRFCRAAHLSTGDPVLRITGDCPFVDPALVDRLVALYRSGSYDHVGVATGAGASHMKEGRFPDGLDAECIRLSALETALRESDRPEDREHVTPFIWRQPGRFRLGKLTSDVDYSALRWTVDHEDDFAMVTRVYAALYREDQPFLMKDILDYLSAHPEVAALNRGFIGQEGYGKLWK